MKRARDAFDIPETPDVTTYEDEGGNTMQETECTDPVILTGRSSWKRAGKLQSGFKEGIDTLLRMSNTSNTASMSKQKGS